MPLILLSPTQLILTQVSHLGRTQHDSTVSKQDNALLIRSVCTRATRNTTLLPSLLKINIVPPFLRRERNTQTGGGPQDDPRELAVARTGRSRRPHQQIRPPIFRYFYISLFSSHKPCSQFRRQPHIFSNLVIV